MKFNIFCFLQFYNLFIYGRLFDIFGGRMNAHVLQYVSAKAYGQVNLQAVRVTFHFEFLFQKTFLLFFELRISL